MRLGIQNLVGENIDEVAQSLLHTLHNIARHWAGLAFHEAAVQVGVGLDDVKMGVLRLGEVGVEFRQAHIGYLVPFARLCLDIAVVHLVE